MLPVQVRTLDSRLDIPWSHALLPAFLVAVLATPGVPAKAVTLVLVYSMGLMGALIPYASGLQQCGIAAGISPR